MSGIHLAAIAPLGALRALRSLTVRGGGTVYSFAARPDSIAPLSALRKLELLMLEGPLGPLAIELDAVSELKQLVDLVLVDSDLTRITNAAPLGTLRQLRQLDLAQTSLTTLQGLFDCSLETLSVPETVPLEEVLAYRARHPQTTIVHGRRRFGDAADRRPG